MIFFVKYGKYIEFHDLNALLYHVESIFGESDSD